MPQTASCLSHVKITPLFLGQRLKTNPSNLLKEKKKENRNWIQEISEAKSCQLQNCGPQRPEVNRGWPDGQISSESVRWISMWKHGTWCDCDRGATAKGIVLYRYFIACRVKLQKLATLISTRFYAIFSAHSNIKRFIQISSKTKKLYLNIQEKTVEFFCSSTFVC